MRLPLLFSRRARSWPQWTATVLALICLAACSPRYNWRVVEASDGFTATFPARVQKETRQIELGAGPASMTMTGAEVDHVSFVIGVATLNDQAAAQQAPQALADALAKNLALQPPVLAAQTLAVAATRQRVPGVRFELAGSATLVFARMAVRSGHVVEILVAGPIAAFKDAATLEARDTFFDSVQLY